MDDSFLVFFRSGACNVDSAAKALAACGLTVEREDDELIVGRPDVPGFPNLWFLVRLASRPHVAAEAAEIGAGTPHEDAMKKCDVRFEVGIADFDAALDEFNTLMDVEKALQDASQGFLFLPWNGQVLPPSTT